MDKSEELVRGRLSWDKVGQSAQVGYNHTGLVLVAGLGPSLTWPGSVEQCWAMTDSGLPRC